MKNGLLMILADMLGEQYIEIEPPTPMLCQAVPGAIDRSLIPERLNRIEFFGYDFDTADIKAYLIDVSESTDPVDPIIDNLVARDLHSANDVLRSQKSSNQPSANPAKMCRSSGSSCSIKFGPNLA